MSKQIPGSQTMKIKKAVFFPAWLILVAMVIVSLTNEKAFLDGLALITGWILSNFAWAFNSTAILCVIVVIAAYFSPLGHVRIGGRRARPIMKYWDWVWITLCTTIAAGILFWGCAEPLYHLYAPPVWAGVEAGGQDAALFAMKAMLLEWTWTPYAIYTVATVVFAFAFFNMRKPYSLGSSLSPLFGDKSSRYNELVDAVCLFALVTGMAASLGTGTMTIAGGIENILGLKSGPVSWGFIIIAIVATFIISSISGIMKGIRKLSSINAKVYIFLLSFVFIFGPTVFMLNFTADSLGSFITDFPRMSLMTGEIFNDGWAKSWPIFYWCNWLAWTPICAIFLGRIAYGYTVRDVIKCNFVIPSLFGTIWMGLFSTSSLYYELGGEQLYDTMLTLGTESVVYQLFEKMPLAIIIIPFYIFIVFISFVTASDSNTVAMSGLCTSGIDQEHQDSPGWLKILWGATIGVVTWILISFAGIDGIKSASNLGGFPNMFLLLAMCAGLIKIMLNPIKYDVHKEDYDETGNPYISERLPMIEEIQAQKD